MNIFVLNRGSSSIKCSVFKWDALPEQPAPPLWRAHLQWKNHFDEASLSINGSAPCAIQCRTSGEALEKIVESWQANNAQIAAIGHRIVHGGKYFKESAHIDSSVKEKIRSLAEFAPLHNFDDLEGIDILEKRFAGVPQIAVFDTAFHSSMPLAATVYGGPYSWYEKDIRRYGFHGISFQYCARRVEQVAGAPLERVILCHLGSGASLCAVKEGKSIDTTMGFTPLEGLVMDTRSGSIDPGILLHFMQQRRSAQELTRELYHTSGLLGLSGTSSDMRDILARAAKNESRATLALEVYLHRLNASIGGMLASLEGMDAIVFTAGIGENTPLIRKRACQAFSFLGLALDEEKNERAERRDKEISASHTKVRTFVILAQEAFEIARECWKLTR
ncbi:MAG TPA: acetate/propionate family kinase [Rhabdochlamydiaceae bacterium]|jgi:acetate kinase